MLKVLLPEAGSDIKGSMRSADELREAAGFHQDGRQFEELIHILDSELRLITPTDPEGTQAEPGIGPDARYYQLPRDYLLGRRIANRMPHQEGASFRTVDDRSCGRAHFHN